MAKRNYYLIAERQAIKQKLGKQNAIISAIKNGNINKAEVLSGKELISRDPVLEGLTKREDRITKREDRITKREEIERDNEIKEKLQELINKPDFDYNKFIDVFRQMVAEQERIPALEEDRTLFEEPIIEEPPIDEVDFPRALPRRAEIGGKYYLNFKQILNKDEIDGLTDVSVINTLFRRFGDETVSI